MNTIARDELLSAARESFPKLKYKPILQSVRALDKALPQGCWRIRLGAELAWAVLDLEWCAAAGGGELLLTLDARNGKITKRPAPARVRTPWEAVRFADSELDARMRAAAALCPVDASYVADDEWTLQLSKPEPWPRFLRLDIAAPFAASSTVHSMILLMRGVEEFGFRGPEARLVIG